MDWLKRATREFSEKPQTTTIKTIKTPVSEVLKVPHPDLSKKTEAATVPLARFSEPDRAAFERVAAALRAELARRPTLGGIASYRLVLDPQTGEPQTAIVSARRHSDGTVTVAEIAGDWADPTLPDLERWTPPGGAS